MPYEAENIEKMEKSPPVDGAVFVGTVPSLHGYRRSIKHSRCSTMGKSLICSHCAAKTSPHGYKGIKAVVLLSVK